MGGVPASSPGARRSCGRPPISGLALATGAARRTRTLTTSSTTPEASRFRADDSGPQRAGDGARDVVGQRPTRQPAVELPAAEVGQGPRECGADGGRRRRGDGDGDGDLACRAAAARGWRTTTFPPRNSGRQRGPPRRRCRAAAPSAVIREQGSGGLAPGGPGDAARGVGPRPRDVEAGTGVRPPPLGASSVGTARSVEVHGGAAGGRPGSGRRPRPA
jgi:hypothetical protein